MSGATGLEVLTGEQYQESQRDGREVWIDGERVAEGRGLPAPELPGADSRLFTRADRADEELISEHHARATRAWPDPGYC